VPVAFPPGDPAKTALFMALELQASQRVAVTRTCRHAPVYAHEAQESRQVRRARQRAQEAGPRPIAVMMGAGIASCRDCVDEISRQVLAAGIPDQAADGRCGCCGEHLADGFYSCSATAGSIIFMFDACDACRDFATGEVAS
jgi:hypothetical protein